MSAGFLGAALGDCLAAGLAAAFAGEAAGVAAIAFRAGFAAFFVSAFAAVFFASFAWPAGLPDAARAIFAVFSLAGLAAIGFDFAGGLSAAVLVFGSALPGWRLVLVLFGLSATLLLLSEVLSVMCIGGCISAAKLALLTLQVRDLPEETVVSLFVGGLVERFELTLLRED